MTGPVQLHNQRSPERIHQRDIIYPIQDPVDFVTMVIQILDSEQNVHTSKGPVVQILRAFARDWAAIRSAINPPPRVRGVQATRPISSRNAMNMPRLVLKAPIMVKMRNRTFVECRMIARPYNSLRGATTRGPKTNPIMYTETTNDSSSWLLAWNRFMIRGTAGAVTVDAIELHDASWRLADTLFSFHVFHLSEDDI